MNPWPRVKHLFEPDDGSLPDIFVQGLSSEQVVLVYEWVLSQCAIEGEPTLWSLAVGRDLPIREVAYPARAFARGEVESFRHCLAGLVIATVELPTLSISVESAGVSFDYRMGPEWGEPEVLALFEFLRLLRQLVPNAHVFQADEGGYEHPSPEFSQALQAYCAEPSPSGHP